jgi:hypothetical protein
MASFVVSVSPQSEHDESCPECAPFPSGDGPPGLEGTGSQTAASRRTDRRRGIIIRCVVFVTSGLVTPYPTTTGL